jgi:hypothetical protein
MPASTGRLHCDLCSAQCSACVTIPAQWALCRQRLLPPLAGMAVDGGSSVVSCSETPPLQFNEPLTARRLKQAREDVQPANERAGTPSILAASAGDWLVDGGKNSIYAPTPFSHSHLPILLSPASATASVRTGRVDPEGGISLESSRRGQWCVQDGLEQLENPFRLAIAIINDGSGPGRIRDGVSLTGHIRSPQRPGTSNTEYSRLITTLDP